MVVRAVVSWTVPILRVFPANHLSDGVPREIPVKPFLQNCLISPARYFKFKTGPLLDNSVPTAGTLLDIPSQLDSASYIRTKRFEKSGVKPVHES